MDRCVECGEKDTLLNAGGVCAWRAGCHHRTRQHDANVARLLSEMARLDPLDCGHSTVEHEAMLAGDWPPVYDPDDLG